VALLDLLLPLCVAKCFRPITSYPKCTIDKTRATNFTRELTDKSICVDRDIVLKLRPRRSEAGGLWLSPSSPNRTRERTPPPRRRRCARDECGHVGEGRAVDGDAEARVPARVNRDRGRRLPLSSTSDARLCTKREHAQTRLICQSRKRAGVVSRAKKISRRPRVVRADVRPASGAPAVPSQRHRDRA
jgi:hypothetical protein